MTDYTVMEDSSHTGHYFRYPIADYNSVVDVYNTSTNDSTRLIELLESKLFMYVYRMYSSVAGNHSLIYRHTYPCRYVRISTTDKFGYAVMFWLVSVTPLPRV
jgi:hypothetical protein